MKPKFTALLALATAGAVTWGGAHAASEQIVCEQRPGNPSMADCVLLSPATSSAVGADSPGAVTYYVAEPVVRDDRQVIIVPEETRALLVPAAAQTLIVPPAEPAFPREHAARNERPSVTYYIADTALPVTRPEDTVIVPAQRLIVTEPAPFPSAGGAPWPD